MRSFLLVVFLGLFSLLADAKTITLAAFPIPLFIEGPDKGLFVNLTREIAKRNKLDVRIKVLPKGRTLLAYSNNEVQGFFPANDESVIKTAVKTAPFYIKVDYVFFRKEKPLKSLRELEGKTVGVTFRYSYMEDLVLNKKINVEYAPDEVINMKKLSKGLLDAFVAEERSGLKALKISGETNIDFDRKKPLFRQTIYYAFQNTDEGRELAEVFSSTIEAMRKDGQLQRILSTP